MYFYNFRISSQFVRPDITLLYGIRLENILKYSCFIIKRKKKGFELNSVIIFGTISDEIL